MSDETPSPDKVVVVDFRESVVGGTGASVFESFFDLCGEVKKVAVDYSSKLAAVLFETPEEAQTAALLSGSQLGGGTLRVDKADGEAAAKNEELLQQLAAAERVTEVRPFATLKAGQRVSPPAVDNGGGDNGNDEWSTIRIQSDDAPKKSAEEPAPPPPQAAQSAEEWSTIRIEVDAPPPAASGGGGDEWSTMRLAGGDGDGDDASGTMKLTADTGTMVLKADDDDDPFKDLFNDDDDQFFLAPRPVAAKKKKPENPNARKRPTVTRAQRLSQERRRSQMMNLVRPESDSRSQSTELDFVEHLSPSSAAAASGDGELASRQAVDIEPVRRVSPREQTMQSADPDMSRCYGQGIEGAAVDQVTRFFVELRDARALPCLLGDVQCTMELPAKKKKKGKEVKLKHTATDSEGVYDVTYTPKVAGLHRLHVTIAGRSKKERLHVQGSPFSVIVSNVVKQKARKKPKVCDVCSERKVAAKLVRHGQQYFLCRPCVDESTQTFEATGTLRLHERVHGGAPQAHQQQPQQQKLQLPSDVPDGEEPTAEFVTCFACKKETEYDPRTAAGAITCEHCGSTILVAAAAKSPRRTSAAPAAAPARTLKVTAKSCERCKEREPAAVVAMGDDGARQMQLCRECLILLRERTPPDVCEKCAAPGSRPVAKVTLEGGKSLWLCGSCNLATAELQIMPEKCQYCFEQKPAAKLNKGQLKMFLCRDCVKPVTLRVQRKDADAKLKKIEEK